MEKRKPALKLLLSNRRYPEKRGRAGEPQLGQRNRFVSHQHVKKALTKELPLTKGIKRIQKMKKQTKQTNTHTNHGKRSKNHSIEHRETTQIFVKRSTV
jgi:hypothetical protein